MIDYSKIPEDTLETLQAFIKTGRPMGDFCTAVVNNDLKEACGRADEHNAAALFDIVAWLYNHAPAGAWGHRNASKDWPKHLKELAAPKRTCNRHDDCDAADQRARAKGSACADHCHDECCEECFGN